METPSMTGTTHHPTSSKQQPRSQSMAASSHAQPASSTQKHATDRQKSVSATNHHHATKVSSSGNDSATAAAHHRKTKSVIDNAVRSSHNRDSYADHHKTSGGHKSSLETGPSGEKQKFSQTQKISVSTSKGQPRSQSTAHQGNHSRHNQTSNI